MKMNYSDKKQNSVKMKSILVGLGGLLILGIIFSIIQLTTAAPDWPTVGHPWVDMECDTNMCVNTGTSLVGVGINSPASKLHVKDGHTWGSDLSIDATGTTGGRRWLLISTGGNAGEGQGKLLIKDNTGGTRIAIDTAGQVGIGTTGPGQRLDVSGGNIRTSGELISTNANQARFISGNYGVIHRNDGSNYYILLTASGDQYGSWNTLRPFRIANDTGHVYLGNMHLAGYLYDYNNSAGSSGQVLTRSAYGVAWQTSTSLPAGSSGQTLRHDGTSWVASSLIRNDGSNVGINIAPSSSYRLNVSGTGYFSGALTLGTAGTQTSHAVRADRSISTDTGISGGGNLTADRTLSLTYPSKSCSSGYAIRSFDLSSSAGPTCEAVGGGGGTLHCSLLTVGADCNSQYCSSLYDYDCGLNKICRNKGYAFFGTYYYVSGLHGNAQKWNCEGGWSTPMAAPRIYNIECCRYQ